MVTLIKTIKSVDSNTNPVVFEIYKTNTKNVFYILEYCLNGLSYNGAHTFNYRIGLYKEMSKETARTSLTINDKDAEFGKRYFYDVENVDEEYFIAYKPNALEIARFFNHSDMSGFPSYQSIQNMIYYLRTNIDVFTEMLKREYKANDEDVNMFVHKYCKYQNYYIVLELINLFNKTKGDRVKEFQDFIFDTFDYRDTFTGSSVVISAISSMLNLKSNAIPLMYHKDRSKVKQDAYLMLMSIYPNSEYNYKIKDRQPNPEFN